MIKAVIFDFGGVLLRTEDHAPRRELEQKLGMAEGEVDRLVFDSKHGRSAQAGAMTEETFWQRLGEELNLGAELEAFRAAFWAGDVLDEELVDFIRRLRPSYQTALISNAMDGLRADLAGKHEIADAFDLIVISAEEKVTKPAPEIYLRTLEQLGREPEEAVFVDDFARNIEGARALGMAAVHFRPNLDVAAELEKLGVTPQRAAAEGEQSK